MTNLTFSQPQYIYKAAAQGKYGEAAFYAATLALGAFEGGPVGIAAKWFGKATGAAEKAAFGTTGFIDEMGKYLKDDPVEYLNGLRDSDPAAYKQALVAWKTFQDINLDHFNGDVKGAVQWIAEWHNMHANPLSNFTSEGITKYWSDFSDTLRSVQNMARNGQLTIDGEKVGADMVDRIGVGKFGTDEKFALIKAFESLPNQAERINAAHQMINNGYGWAQNPNLRQAILHALGDPAAEGIEDGTQGTSIDMDDMADNAEGTPNQVNPTPTSATTIINPNTGHPVITPVNDSVSTGATLPKNLSGAKPSYSYGAKRFTLSFPDDTTRALYIVAGKNPSAHDEEYMDFLRQQFTGKSDQEIRSMGQSVKDSIKSLAKNAEPGTLDVKSASPAGISVASGAPLGVAPTPTSATTTIPANVSATGKSVTVSSRTITDATTGDTWKKGIMKIATGKEVKTSGDVTFPRNYFPIYLSPTAKGYNSSILENIDNLFSDVKRPNLTSITRDAALTAPRATANPLPTVSDALDRSVAPKAIAGSVGNFFVRMGLSPKDTQATAYIALRRNIADNLLQAGVNFEKEGGNKKLTDVDYVFQQLSKGAEGKQAVYDLRQLKVSDIQTSLRVDEGTAKAVQRSIRQGYLQIPLQVRGLGAKLQDINSRYNPFAIPYSRIQSSLRYAYNPIFHAQEIATSEYIGQALVGGKMLQFPGINTIANVFGRNKGELDSIAIKLDKAGFFGGEGGRSEFAEENLVGMTAHLRPAQRATAAGMVKTLADRAGVDVDTYMHDNATELSQMVRTVAQYPKNSWMNSPLMSTLNLVAFPARFNIKVAAITAQALAKTDPLTQVLVLNSLMRAHDWLNSDEGITWQTKNADALEVLKYFSPLYHLSYISKILTGDIHSMNDLGSLGGLPFGVFAQILSDEGIMQLNAPYINPATGQELPNYIPQTDKAAAATALDDFISSLFTYPGAEVGLLSKTALVEDLTNPIINVKKSDTSQFSAVTPQLNPSQLAQQAIMEQAAGTTPTTPQPTRLNPMLIYNIPPPDLTGRFLVAPKATKTKYVPSAPDITTQSGTPNIPVEPGSEADTKGVIPVTANFTNKEFTPQLLGQSTPPGK